MDVVCRSSREQKLYSKMYALVLFPRSFRTRTNFLSFKMGLVCSNPGEICNNQLRVILLGGKGKPSLSKEMWPWDDVLSSHIHGTFKSKSPRLATCFRLLVARKETQEYAEVPIGCSSVSPGLIRDAENWYPGEPAAKANEYPIISTLWWRGMFYFDPRLSTSKSKPKTDVWLFP